MKHVHFANQTLWNAAQEILAARIIIWLLDINALNGTTRYLGGEEINARFY